MAGDDEMMDDGADNYAADDFMADEEPGDEIGAAASLPSHEEEKEQFMKHCFSHPLAKKMADHYAMDAMPPEGATPGGEEGADEPPLDLGPSPLGPPDGDKPEMNSAMLSGTNSLPDKEKMRMSRESKAIQHARKVKEKDDSFKKLQEEVKQLRYAKVRSECERMVIQIEAKGIEVDRAEEVERLIRLPNEEARKKHVIYVERFHRKGAPVQQYGRIPLAPDESQSNELDLHTRALQYQKQNNVTWDAALEKCRNGKK